MSKRSPYVEGVPAAMAANPTGRLDRRVNRFPGWSAHDRAAGRHPADVLERGPRRARRPGASDVRRQQEHQRLGTEPHDRQHHDDAENEERQAGGDASGEPPSLTARPITLATASRAPEAHRAARRYGPPPMTAGSLTATVGTFVDELAAILDGLTARPGSYRSIVMDEADAVVGSMLAADGRISDAEAEAYARGSAASYGATAGRSMRSPPEPPTRCCAAEGGGPSRPSCSPCSSKPTPGPGRSTPTATTSTRWSARRPRPTSTRSSPVTSWMRWTSSGPRCWRRSTRPAWPGRRPATSPRSLPSPPSPTRRSPPRPPRIGRPCCPGCSRSSMPSSAWVR